MINKKETHQIAKSLGWECDIDYPQWGNNSLYLTTIKGGYLLKDETPKRAYERIANTACKFLKKPELFDKFFEILWNGWLIPSTPVMSNFGTDRGLPISCFSGRVGDDMYEIFRKNGEMAMLSKHGGGTAYDISQIRPAGTPIRNGERGIADGIIPFIKVYDSTIIASKQASVRRGAVAMYLDIEHDEYRKFLDVREPKGDVNRQAHNIHQGSVISNSFMEEVLNKKGKARELWLDTIKKRVKTGEPYIMFKDNANKNLPINWQKNDLEIFHSNLCVTGDQLVVTDNGLKRVIDLVNSGEKLTLFDGDKIVSASPMKLIKKDVPVYKVTTKSGRNHTITDNHKLLTENGWIQCKDLHIGDKVKIQKNEGLFGSINKPKEAFLLGLYHGDGTQYKSIRFIDLWENDFDLINEIEDSISFLYENHNWDHYNISNQFGETTKKRKTKMPQFFDCSQTNGIVKKKRLQSNKLHCLNFEKENIPKWIFEGNKKTQSEYLRGLYFADGTASISNSKGQPIYIGLTNISLEFLEEIQIILSNLGINSKIYDQNEGGKVLLPNGKGGLDYYNQKKSYRLIIGDKKSAIKFNDLTKFLDRKGLVVKKRDYRDNTKKYDEIVSIEQLENEDVYCCTVYTDEHAWVCNSFITHNCSEIFLPTDNDHTLVCCLSSLNLYKYDEWKNTDTIFYATLLLDAVISEFIEKGNEIKGIEDAVRFAEKSRALGLGALGWHTYLQSKMIPFISIQANSLTTIIFKQIEKESKEASRWLANEYGEPEWMKGTGSRNLTNVAIAPNRSSSKLAGGISQGIEPFGANAYVDDDAKGLHMRKNPILKSIIKERKINNDIWDRINEDRGSIANISEFTAEEKEVFKTFKEINQLELVRQAGIRQKYIDQGQSINLAFYQDAPARFINQVHLEAWKVGLKSLYYFRSESNLRADKNQQRDLYSECIMCEG